MNKELERFHARLKSLDQEFAPLEAIAKEVRNNINPSAGLFPVEGKLPYDPVANDDRLNCEPTRAWQTHASGMLQGNCSPARPWMQLQTEDPDLNNYTPVKEWLDAVEKIYLKTFAQSNFYNVQHTILGEQGGFGTGCYLPEPLAKPPWIHFYHYAFGSYRLAVNKYGEHDTFYCHKKMQARVAMQWFGPDNLSDGLKRAAEKDPYKYFDIIHVIEPREDADRDFSKIDNLNMPFKSVWFEKGKNDKVLKESGYPVFPVIAPRFLTMQHYAYGIGPGIDSINRVLMLQEMEKTGLVGLHREVSPALQADTAWQGILDLTPDAMNFGIGSPISPIVQTNINWQHFQFRLDKIEDSINRAFMVDLFLMISQAAGDDPQKTATEIIAKEQEKLTVLGPVVLNQHSQNFDRVIDIMLPIFSSRRDFNGEPILPPPPEELQGQQIKTKYVSVLAQAQRMADIDGIRTLLTMRDIVSIGDPGHQVNLAFDEYEILKATEEAASVPANIIIGRDKFNDRVQAQQEQAAQAQQMAQLEQAAGMAGQLGGASTEPGTALGDLKEAAS